MPAGLIIMVAEFVVLVILLRAGRTMRQRITYVAVFLVAFTVLAYVLLATATTS